ncbi:MAG TPA: family 10 glycosylhydrolase [Chthoniobacteraceae bacterium]|nr:family 10 glycosylhydrolase [Chthoniobacteraceae bacterium]
MSVYRIFLYCMIPLVMTAWGRAAETEFRAAWVASVYNIDWPSKAGLSTSQQQGELRRLLDRAASLNLNAILLQIRPESDALYASEREPWSRYLTGTQGRSPGYDPLAFAIKEAHARGIELHAWFNPFRAAANAKNPVASNHVTRRHPEWVRRFGGQLWLDPGEPAAREYVIDIMVDVARRYPVDGIHIDDYFYPYPKKGHSFPDSATAARYRKGRSLADWRRDNVNTFVRTMYSRVKAARPSAKIGISPFGIWRPGVPSTIEAGVDSYADLFADSRKWLAEGWCDYLAPQLYWSISPSKQSFAVLLEWWRQQSHGKPVWPGIATTRIGPNRSANEIVNQIALTRRGHRYGSPGHIHWSMKGLLENQGGIADKLRNGPYAKKADPR